MRAKFTSYRAILLDRSLDSSIMNEAKNRFPRTAFALALFAAVVARAEPWVHATAQPGDFALATPVAAAPIVFSPEDFKVVDLAAHDLATDIERVTGRKPAVRSDARDLRGPAVLVGTLGKNPAIDALVAAGKLGDAASIAALRGAWESFLIATVADPLPGVPSALVIVGSDRRGTAFGVYELSQAIGVSPWYWWADVTPEKQPALHLAAGTRRFGPPSVKYRGIFINDEDWGLHQWAAKTFEPEHGGIGPKTYAKIFELLLRLKANTLWPAMHAVSMPFNAFAENAPLADAYAIVMGSSHAEPMLRNNVGEWPHDRDADYNYLTNRDGVLKYWEERVATNGRYENIYTLGMRGIHDSNMQGPKTDPERIRTLEQIFADQRAVLAAHVRPEVERVPQMFCAYKEVLGLYRQGLKVPDDVTIVWPDDNHGYIRNYATADERKRAGGFGVYYHLSYLGAPLSYLWLYTTPPALVWEEMTKAYDHGARTIWIANVGDLKPAEIGTEFFLQLAWDINRWHRDNLDDFLAEWAAREFGGAAAPEIAAIMRRYYQLNFQRRPEHLQWWLPRETPRPSPLSDNEVTSRLAAFRELRERAGRVDATLSRALRTAFAELVGYPVEGAAFANERYFNGELAAIRAPADSPLRQQYLAKAQAVDARLRVVTDEFNQLLAGGKWHDLMRVEPADEQWKSFRTDRWEPPKFAVPAAPLPRPSAGREGGVLALEAEHFTRKIARSGAAWEVIPGLGRTGDSVAVFPTTTASVPLEKLATDAPRLDYDITFTAAGEFPVAINLIPTHAFAGGALRFALALDDAPPQLVSLDVNDGGAEWAQGVLNATRIAHAKIAVPSAGAHTLRVYAVDAGVVLDKIVVDCGGLTPSYLGPPESRTTAAR